MVGERGIQTRHRAVQDVGDEHVRVRSRQATGKRMPRRGAKVARDRTVNGRRILGAGGRKARTALGSLGL